MLKYLNALLVSGLISTNVLAVELDCPTVPNKGVKITIPTSDFILQGSVAIHKTTGLMWQRCMAGEVLYDNNTPNRETDDLCVDDPLPINLINSYDYLMQLNSGIYSDWRTPNIKELYSIYENCPSVEGITLNTVVFPISLANRSIEQAPKLWSSSDALQMPQILYSNNLKRALRFVRDTP